MFTLIIIVSISLEIVLSLFVLQNNPKSRSNQFFFFLNAFVTVWALINFLITRDPFSSSQLLLYRLLMGSVVLQNTLFYLFSHTYPHQKSRIAPKKQRNYLIFSAVAFLVALSPILFVKVGYGSAGARPVAGPGMLIFITHAAISIAFGFRSLLRSFRKSTGRSRQQFRLMLISSIVLWGIVPVTNFVVSLATQTLFFSRISPIYTLAFASIIAYAMVKHRFFDIRTVVARAVTYLITTFVIVAGYVLLAFGVKRLLSPNDEIGTSQLISNIALTIVLVLIYPTLQQWFNRITSKVFFRDSYDTQSFLDELNNILVSSLEIDGLLKKTSQLIEANLKSQFCSFFIHNTEYLSSRLISDQTKRINDSDMSSIRKLLPQAQKKVIDVDEEHGDGEEKDLAKLVKENGGQVVAKIVTASDTKGEGIGYFLVGPKRSGNPYTSQDIKILEILANELVIAIENSLRFEEIEQFNVTLQQKVSEATRELRRTNEKLKALDEAKDEFISMASHQLRTPLTSVKGYLSMLSEGDAGKLNTAQKQFVNQAFVSSQRMVYLIADLLNVSRLKTGKFIIEATPVYLPDVIESEIAQLYETVKARGISMSFDKPKEFPMLSLDETKIRQVVMNFTDNAIYYTPSGGTIKLDLHETPESIEFTVKDDGIGVPKQEQHHLFTKFYRAGNARKTRPDGTGLGLFMAQKVVVAQGGAIIFKSQEGKGSTFGFSFAKKKLAIPDIKKT